MSSRPHGLLLLSSAAAFDVMEILQPYNDYATFTKYLTETKLADVINIRGTVTVLVVDNSAIAPISALPADKRKSALSVHILPDYYDPYYFHRNLNKSAVLPTLYQAAGQAGYLNFREMPDQNMLFGSAVPGAPQDSYLVKVVGARPYNLSVLQISKAIVPPGIGSASPTLPTLAAATRTNAQAPPLTKSASAAPAAPKASPATSVEALKTSPSTPAPKASPTTLVEAPKTSPSTPAVEAPRSSSTEPLDVPKSSSTAPADAPQSSSTKRVAAPKRSAMTRLEASKSSPAAPANGPATNATTENAPKASATTTVTSPKIRAATRLSSPSASAAVPVATSKMGAATAAQGPTTRDSVEAPKGGVDATASNIASSPVSTPPAEASGAISAAARVVVSATLGLAMGAAVIGAI